VTYLPELRPDLVTALAALDVDDFAVHEGKITRTFVSERSNFKRRGRGIAVSTRARARRRARVDAID
jgi:hypothetical protein